MKTYNVTIKSPGTPARVLVIYSGNELAEVKAAAEELFGKSYVMVAEAK